MSPQMIHQAQRAAEALQTGTPLRPCLQAVLATLSPDEPLTPREICARCGWAYQAVMRALSDLEDAGKAEKVKGAFGKGAGNGRGRAPALWVRT